MNLSKKPREPKDYLCVALDTQSAVQALKLVQGLSPHVGTFKIGLEFEKGYLKNTAQLRHEYALEEFHAWRKLYAEIRPQLFWDAKLKDIPNTVVGAAKQISLAGVHMFNVHCDGGMTMMRKALKAAELQAATSPDSRRPLVIGVTVLTSLNEEELEEMERFPPMPYKATEEEMRERLTQRVRHLALLAKECRLDGVVCSPGEARIVRESCGEDFLIVTPCIRSNHEAKNDQKRTATIAEAIRAGSDLLVIGRPIVEARDPIETAKRMADEIAEALVQKEG